MADVKREVRALGQKITGLKAGDNVTLVLKAPKPRVDATAAKKAAKISSDNISTAKDLMAELSRAHGMAKGGDHASARKIVDAAKDMLDDIKASLPRAKDWAKTASQDNDSAPGEVKDGYGAAKDGADLVVGHLEKVAEGIEKAITAVGALVEETPNRQGA
jgi:hypothetical protein